MSKPRPMQLFLGLYTPYQCSNLGRTEAGIPVHSAASVKPAFGPRAGRGLFGVFAPDGFAASGSSVPSGPRLGWQASRQDGLASAGQLPSRCFGLGRCLGWEASSGRASVEPSAASPAATGCWGFCWAEAIVATVGPCAACLGRAWAICVGASVRPAHSALRRPFPSAAWSAVFFRASA